MSKSKGNTFILVDTNIFVQCCLFEKKGDDEKSIESLIKILDDNKATLLLPEIVKKEFYKRINSESYEDWAKKFKTNIENGLNQFIQSQEQKIKDQKSQQSKPPVELSERLFTNFRSDLDKFLGKQIKEFKKTQKKIEAIFNHKNTLSIPFKRNDFFEAYRLFFSGEKPSGDKAIQSDAVIITGIYSFLKKKKNYQFVLCSNDYKDFASNTASVEKGLEDEIELHPHIKSKIKGASRYYMFLSVLLNKEFKIKIKPDIVQAEETDINRISSTNELVNPSK